MQVMKKVICYTDGVSVYAGEDMASIYLGAIPADTKLEEYKEPEKLVNSAATVELVTAGVKVEDIVKLKLNGLL